MRQRTPLAFGLEVEAKIGTKHMTNTSMAAASTLFKAVNATADQHHQKTERRSWSVQLDTDDGLMVCSHPHWRPLELVSPKLYEPAALLPGLRHMMHVGLAWDVTSATHIHGDRSALDTRALGRVLSCYVAHEHVFDGLTHASRHGTAAPSPARRCGRATRGTCRGTCGAAWRALRSAAITLGVWRTSCSPPARPTAF